MGMEVILESRGCPDSQHQVFNTSVIKPMCGPAGVLGSPAKTQLCISSSSVILPSKEGGRQPVQPGGGKGALGADLFVGPPF